MPKTFCVVGHDARQRAAAQALRTAGYRAVGPETAAQADYVLLPMSQERVSDEVARTLQAVRPGTLLLAGRPGAPVRRAVRSCPGKTVRIRSSLDSMADPPCPQLCQLV